MTGRRFLWHRQEVPDLPPGRGGGRSAGGVYIGMLVKGAQGAVRALNDIKGVFCAGAASSRSAVAAPSWRCCR